VATLSSLYGWAEGKHVARGFNPCALVERFPEVGKERYLTDDELKQLSIEQNLVGTIRAATVPLAISQ